MVVLFLVLQQSIAERNESRNAYQRLLSQLFEGYDSDAHPGGGASVKVWLAAKVVRIVSINEKNNALQSQWWMTQVRRACASILAIMLSIDQFFNAFRVKLNQLAYF